MKQIVHDLLWDTDKGEYICYIKFPETDCAGYEEKKLYRTKKGRFYVLSGNDICPVSDEYVKRELGKKVELYIQIFGLPAEA